MLTRRTLFSAPLALIVPGALSPLRADPTSAARTRFGVNAPEAAPHLEALAKAIKIMRSAEAPEKFTWEHQRQIHAGHWRQHWTWRFLPWHRAQLLCFEEIVRHLSGFADFAHPYWDPNDHKRIPALFLDEASPFYHKGRKRGLEALNFVAEFNRLVSGGRYRLAEIGGFEFLDFAGLADEPGAVDRGIHGLVHVMIGGDMGAPDTAPLDPLFWFHHCNIDRMWATWQSHEGAYAAEQYPADFNAESFSGIFTTVSGDEYQATAADLLDHRAIFAYDKLYSAPIIVRAAPPPPTAGEGAPKLAEAPRQKKKAARRRVTQHAKVFAALLPASAREGTFARLNIPIGVGYRPIPGAKQPIEISHAIAKLRLRADSSDKVALRIYLAPQGFNGELRPTGPEYVDEIALYGALHHAQEAHFSLDLTQNYVGTFERGARGSVDVIVELVRFEEGAAQEIIISDARLEVTARAVSRG